MESQRDVVDNLTCEATLMLAPVGMVIIALPSLVFVSANNLFLEAVSLTAIVGRAWADVFADLVGTETDEAIQRVAEGHSAKLELSLARLGEADARYCSLALEPIRNAEGRPQAILGIAVDVTDLVVRRREAEALAARARMGEERYRALLETIDDGFCVIELVLDEMATPVDYRFLEANRAFLRQAGIPDAVGRTAKELAPSLDASCLEWLWRVATSGEPGGFENHTVGADRLFDVFATRLGDATNRHVALVFKDVTARKENERTSGAVLACEQSARQDAEAANQLKDEFLAAVSHELRTPLNAMLGWVSLLRGGRLDPEKAERALEVIERNARAQAQLIEELLDVSQIAEGKLRLDVDLIELGPVLLAAVEAIRPAAAAKGLRLDVQLPHKGTIRGDAHRLKQVVSNLLVNAVKFTPEGGRVAMTADLQGSSVDLVVADTGIGIAEDVIPHVFERFRQGDSGVTRRSGGLGLGLSIVKHLVELHGGTVSAFSEGHGRGARFDVRLPLALRNRASPPPRSGVRRIGADVASTPNLVGLKVLAIDHPEDTSTAGRGLLEACGAEVTVTSAAEAFRRFQEDAPDIVLMNVEMSEENPFALVAKIRALPSHAGGSIPTVALTAHARKEDRGHCLEAGFSRHLARPFQADELLRVVSLLAERGIRPS